MGTRSKVLWKSKFSLFIAYHFDKLPILANSGNSAQKKNEPKEAIFFPNNNKKYIYYIARSLSFKRLKYKHRTTKDDDF